MAKATALMMLPALYDLDGAQKRLRREAAGGPPSSGRGRLRGKTVGFIGLGKIGRETARLSRHRRRCAIQRPPAMPT